MTRHWRSVIFLLVPVMTFGWLITSVFIWGLIRPLNWLDSLCVAACVTATDPVLASSVVGKGKFARRIPKHLRDLTFSRIWMQRRHGISLYIPITLSNSVSTRSWRRYLSLGNFNCSFTNVCLVLSSDVALDTLEEDLLDGLKRNSL